METNYTYSSYPDSGDSSPRSRDVDPSENNPAASWEDAPPPQAGGAGGSGRVKLMISYGGKIQPRPHDNQLSYLNGETKILSIERSMRFSDFHSKLASISSYDDVCIKYQLPGEDLDALVSITNEEDLDHMVLEFDRLCRSSATRGTPRIRVFLFPINRSKAAAPAPEGSAERHWFVDALNSVPPLASPVQVSNSPDYLFGLENGFVLPPAVKVKDPTVPDQPLQRENVTIEVPVKEESKPAADLSSPVEIQKQIHELEKIQIADNNSNSQSQVQPPPMARSASDETLARAAYLPPVQSVQQVQSPPVQSVQQVQSPPVQSVQQVQSPPASAVPQPTVTAPPGYFGSMAGGGGDHRPMYLYPHPPPGYFTTGGASFVYAMAPPGQAAGGPPPPMPAGYDGAGRAVYYTSMVPTGYRHQTVTSTPEATNP